MALQAFRIILGILMGGTCVFSLIYAFAITTNPRNPSWGKALVWLGLSLFSGWLSIYSMMVATAAGHG